MKTDTPPSVAAVVLHWGDPQLTKDLLASLFASSYPNLTVFLLDQGLSLDVDLRAHDVLMHSDENLGFCGGNNRAMAEALRRGFDYVLLINNDTIVETKTLEILVRALESSDRAAAASPTVLFETPAATIWYAGGAYDNRRAWSWHLNKYEPFDRAAEAPVSSTPFIPWCAIIVKADVLRDVGMLDERFFMYWEDNDWCLRALKSGYDLLYVPSSIVTHRIGDERDVNSPQRLYYFFRNWLLFIRLHTPRRWVVRAWISFADRLARESVKVFTRYKVNRREYLRMFLRAVFDNARRRFGRLDA